MSQFPDNEAARETEAVMRAIVPMDKKVDTAKYNRAFEAIYAVLMELEAKEKERTLGSTQH